MKKIFILLLIFIFTVFSCKQADDGTNNTKKEENLSYEWDTDNIRSVNNISDTDIEKLKNNGYLYTKTGDIKDGIMCSFYLREETESYINNEDYYFSEKGTFNYSYFKYLRGGTGKPVIIKGTYKLKNNDGKFYVTYKEDGSTSITYNYYSSPNYILFVKNY